MSWGALTLSGLQGGTIVALGGYANRIARVDLNTSAIEYEPINEEDAR